MPGAADAPTSPAARPRRPRRSRRPAAVVLAVLGLLVLAWAVAVAVSGAQAVRALQRVADAAPALERDLRAQRFAQAVPVAEDVAADAAAAARATGQLPYRAAGHVPWVGDQLRALGAGALAAAALTEPLPRALTAAQEVLGDGFLAQDGAVDVAALQRVSPLVTDYATRVEVARAALERARGPRVLDALATRLEPVSRRLEEVAGPARAAGALAPQLPAMLGSEGARTYLVAFTNPAEIRPVQGLVGAYAYVSVDAGRVSLVRTGSNDDLQDARSDVTVNGEEFLSLYGRDPDAALVQNLTVGAQADDAARLAVSLVADAGLPTPDAVVLVDPVGLGVLLGPDQPPLQLGPFGEVAAGDLPEVLMHDAYVRYEDDNDAREEFLAAASAAAFEAVLSDGLSADALSGGREAVASGHLAVWSSRPEEQEALVAAGLAGVLGDPAATPATAHLGLTNAAPSKLDYWVRAAVELSPPCAAGAAQATGTVQLTLTNTVPEEIPWYTRNQRHRSDPVLGRTARDVVSLWVPPQVGLDGATVDGTAVGTAVDSEHGWRLVRLTVDVPPGEAVVVEWRLRGRADALPVTVTPPSTASTPEVRTIDCSQ
ncbi:DUF4012 domain-containing protein [Kineococcus auxinigenes]|uniref:DUF4012 domain-containing protein n=1 Tax=unclassified Kineococcus TaxID=2621656 RepID=UPI003D7CF26E